MQHAEQRGVRIPTELQAVPPRQLEEYVRARLIQFASAFARRLNPTLNEQTVQNAAADALASLPPPEFGASSIENRDLQLVFRHDCLSLGCLDAQCVLCEHNPHRRCNVNFAPKYLVNDVLKAKCEAPIRVEIIDRATGVPLGEDLPDVHLEMCILDGNAYDAKCLEAGQELDSDLDACSLLVNNKQTQPLLVPGGAASHNSQNKVVVQLSRGMAQLPDLHVSDSSEAMLSGRKPPFRLMVRAVSSDGSSCKFNIRHAVSEGFVVATRRTRTAGKVEIPNVDDHVSKLEHMGKETVKKLQDIANSAQQAGVEISVPDNCINKVGEFRKLALMAEADGHLRQKLQQVLKLSKEKWDDARDHAMKAVVADNRMRIWYADKATMELGLLFTCRLGNVDLERPVGLLQKKSQDGAQTTMEATLMAQQTPAQREQVRHLQPQAVASWWQQGHPGWAIYPVDSESFLSSGGLESVSLPHDQVMPPPSSPSPGPTRAPATRPGRRPRSPDSALPPVRPGAPPAAYSGLPSAPPAFYGNGIAGQPHAAVSGAAAYLGSAPAALPPFVPPADVAVAGSLPPPLAAGGRFRAPDLPGSLPPSLLAAAAKPPARAPSSSPFAGMPPPPRNPLPPSLLSGQRSEGSAGASSASGGSAHHNSPFANQQLQATRAMVEGGPNYPALASVFSGPLASADLSKFQSAGLSLAGFPSIPAALPSGELDHLLHAHADAFGHGGYRSNRADSIGMGKLESMELPDAVAAVAMLHDMPPEQRAAGGPGQQGGAGAPGMQRSNSGLESMQSIEQALGGVQQDIIEHAAEDWRQQHHNPGQQAQAAAQGQSGYGVRQRS